MSSTKGRPPGFNEIVETRQQEFWNHLHSSLKFIFLVIAQIILNLLNNHPFSFEK